MQLNYYHPNSYFCLHQLIAALCAFPNIFPAAFFNKQNWLLRFSKYHLIMQYITNVYTDAELEERRKQRQQQFWRPGEVGAMQAVVGLCEFSGKRELVYGKNGKGWVLCSSSVKLTPLSHLLFPLTITKTGSDHPLVIFGYLQYHMNV